MVVSVVSSPVTAVRVRRSGDMVVPFARLARWPQPSGDRLDGGREARRCRGRHVAGGGWVAQEARFPPAAARRWEVSAAFDAPRDLLLTLPSDFGGDAVMDDHHALLDVLAPVGAEHISESA